jgi:uncharacterized protein YbjT (DUF2867 family)
MKALILGATGLVGRHVLNLLLKESAYSQVQALVRKTPEGFPSAPGKLDLQVVDFDHLPPGVSADHIYCCIGTTLRQAGSQEAFRRVDFDYPVSLARSGAQGGTRKYLLVSSVGANEHSQAFYLRVKGETESQVIASGIPEVHVFRPSFLLGKRTASRPLENLGITILRPLAPLMAGPARIYRPIQASQVAHAMVARALEPEHRGAWVHQGKELG